MNKLAEIKSATVTVNVKSLTGGYETTVPSNSTDTVVKKKKLTVKAGEDKVYDEDVDLNSTNIKVNVSGKGTVTVKVYIDDVLYKQDNINLNTTSSYTFE